MMNSAVLCIASYALGVLCGALSVRQIFPARETVNFLPVDPRFVPSKYRGNGASGSRTVLASPGEIVRYVAVRAAAQAVENGQPIGEMARDAGLSEVDLKKWMAAFDDGGIDALISYSGLEDRDDEGSGGQDGSDHPFPVCSEKQAAFEDDSDKSGTPSKASGH